MLFKGQLYLQFLYNIHYNLYTILARKPLRSGSCQCSYPPSFKFIFNKTMYVYMHLYTLHSLVFKVSTIYNCLFICFHSIHIYRLHPADTKHSKTKIYVFKNSQSKDVDRNIN